MSSIDFSKLEWEKRDRYPYDVYFKCDIDNDFIGNKNDQIHRYQNSTISIHQQISTQHYVLGCIQAKYWKLFEKFNPIILACPLEEAKEIADQFLDKLQKLKVLL